MKRFKIVAAVLSAAIIMASFTGFKSQAVKAKPSKSPITADVCPTPDTLDPQIISNGDIFDITSTMLEGLMKTTSSNTGFGIAKSCSISSDKLTYTFKLRDAKWSDGKAVTASDFVYSLRRLFSPKTAAANASIVSSYFKNASAILAGKMNVDKLGVKAVGSKVLKITTPTRIAEKTMYDVLSKQYCAPLRKDMVSKSSSWANKAKTNLSDGPYVMSSYSPDSSLVVKKNSKYWNAKAVNASQIKFMFFNDDNAAQAAYQSGKLDIYKYPSHNFRTQAASISQSIKPIATRDTYFMIFNQKKAPFNNKLVRKAFSLAINNEYFAKTVRQGDAIAATGMVGPGFSDYVKGDFRKNGGNLIGDYKKDLAKAKQALAQAGYKNGKGLPEITYICTGSQINQKNAQAMQALLKQNLGINIEIKTEEAKVYISDVLSNNYQFIMIQESATVNDCTALLKLFQNTGYYGLNIKPYESLMKQAFTAKTPKAQSAALHKAENVLINEDYALHPIYHSKFTPAIRKGISGYIATSAGEIILNYATKK